MKKAYQVTFLAVTVLTLASGLSSTALASSTTLAQNNSSIYKVARGVSIRAAMASGTVKAAAVKNGNAVTGTQQTQQSQVKTQQQPAGAKSKTGAATGVTGTQQVRQKGVTTTEAGVASASRQQLYRKAQVAVTGTQNNTSVMSADSVRKEETAAEPVKFSGLFVVSRNRSMIDFEDGSREDGMDYLFNPALTTSFGKFSAKIAYSQNLHDDPETNSKTASDWADVPVTFAFKPYSWLWTPPYVLSVTPTITAAVPISKVSTKRDMLQTAVSGGVSFAITPDGIAPKKDGAWSLAVGVTAGRAFHTYEENIVGTVLNKYSSNQTLNLGYSYKSFSVSTEYIHKTRWTYQGNVRDSFELSEEIGYDINDNYSVALGHTNTGAGLKEDASTSNFKIVNENDSTIYVQMGVSF